MEYGEALTRAAAKRLHAAATMRNREPLLAVLKQRLPHEGRLLEIASGTGEHALYFSEKFPGLEWQPSDVAEDAIESIAAWRTEATGGNLRAPIRLDVTEPDWSEKVPARPDAILCINMIHIAPWDAAVGLFAGAGKLIAPGAPLLLYGAFKRHGAHTAPSNVDFDEMLRARDPRHGVRDLESEVVPLGERAGFKLDAIDEMPANNMTVTFLRTD